MSEIEDETPEDANREHSSETSVESIGGLPVSRRMSRELALRAVYSIEHRSCSVDEALKDPLVTDNQPVTEFCRRLVSQTLSNREQLDDIIRNKIERWEFHRVAVIDRIILRMAVAEMLFFDDVPPKVTMNEAIEIGKKFSTENSGRFINGVLDSIYGDMGRGDKLIPDGGGKETD